MKQTNSVGQLLRLPSVENITGLSKSEIYRRVKTGDFPKPIKLGARAVAWSSASVQDWFESMIKDAGSNDKN
jgi:prophage regulatory protein